jgi:hypothetical protein
MDPDHHRDGGVLADDRRPSDKIECVILPQVVTKFSGISEIPIGRVLLGGWSKSLSSMRLCCVFSDEGAALDREERDSREVVQPDAFQLHGFRRRPGAVRKVRRPAIQGFT